MAGFPVFLTTLLGGKPTFLLLLDKDMVLFLLKTDGGAATIFFRRLLKLKISGRLYIQLSVYIFSIVLLH